MALSLREVMNSKTHWYDESLTNPCTEFFVHWCIVNFPAGRTWNGVGDTHAHFHSWVNEQVHPMIIPAELTSQMWQLREDRKRPVPLEFEMCHLLLHER